MCKKIKRVAITIGCLLATVLTAAAVAACTPRYDPKKDIPGINSNAVLNIDKTELSFALGMDIDPVDIIVRCGCVLTDDEGHEVPVTKKHLTDGAVKFTDFEINTVGLNKQITVSYKNATNYIFYDVAEYTAEFYADDGTAWKSESASAEFDSKLDLAVWVNVSDYNYSVDADARRDDAYHAERFNGWYTNDDKQVTGRVYMPVSNATESTLSLRAGYLTDAQFAALRLSYDARGRRVFSGYVGSDDTAVVPEGVTYIDFDAIFHATPDATAIGFTTLDIPSTARADLPLQTALNTRGLEKIEVDEGSAYYASFDGALYSKNFKTLYLMPSSCAPTDFPEQVEEFEKFSCAYWEVMKFALPDSVHTLHDYCFAYSELLEVIGIEHVDNVMSGVLWGSRVPTLEEDGGYYTALNGKYMLSSVDKSVVDFTVKSGTVGIAGNAFSGCTLLESVDLGDELESIGEYAFMNCSALKSITLPSSVTYIGDCAFYGCSELERVDNMENVKFSQNDSLAYAVPRYLFAECKKLRYVELPSELDAIGAYAFRDCTALESLNLHNVREIEVGAFYYCGIKSAVLPESLETLGVNVFMGSGLTSVDLSKCTKLTELPARSFQQSKLVSVVVPSHITELGGYCFYYITTLVSVKLENVHILENYAFGNCTALSNLELSPTLTTISTRAFSNCNRLVEVVLPDSVETVGGYAFVCSNLKRITLGANLKTFGSYAYDTDGETFKTSDLVLFTANNLEEIVVSPYNENFKVKDGALYGNSVCGIDYGDYGVLYFMPPAIKGMTEFVDQDNTQIILPYAFQGQKMLTDVTFGEGVTNIGKVTFYASSSLERVHIPSTVVHIGVNIILDCTNNVDIMLSEDNDTIKFENGVMYSGNSVLLGNAAEGVIRIKEGTTLISSGAFMNNSKITEIYIPDSVTQIDDKAFENCSGLEYLSIGAGLTKLNGTPFRRLASLKQIAVSADNKSFKTVYGNMLYTFDGKTLVLCAASNGMTDLTLMLDTVETIGAYAFSDHKTLTNITLPEGVKTISDYAFYECRALESFYASYSLKTIGSYAFSFKTSIDPANKQENRYCDKLKTVLLRDQIEAIGAYAFYGQYGIQQVFYEMTESQVQEFWLNKNINTTNASYLRRGCPKGDGTFYNKEDGSEISRYLYSRVKPQIMLAEYEWFYFDGDGNPVPWNDGYADDESADESI